MPVLVALSVSGCPGVCGGLHHLWNKAPNLPPAGLLRPLPVSRRPWSHIALDFVTGLPPSSGNTVTLTVDRFSKAAHFFALPKLPSALETAQLPTQHVFRLHGIPLDIVSDCGPQFTSRVWKEFCTNLGAQVSLSSGFHPQTNGQSEWANQELEAMLRCVVSSNQALWNDQLAWVEYAHNSSTSAATGVSPFEASRGVPTSAPFGLRGGYGCPLGPASHAALPASMAGYQGGPSKNCGAKQEAG